jgi:hypothetical protein
MPERRNGGLTLRDSMYSRKDYGNDDGEGRTTIRQYLVIPQRNSVTDGYQRACRPPRVQGNEESLSDVSKSRVGQARVKAESSRRTGVGL